MPSTARRTPRGRSKPSSGGRPAGAAMPKGMLFVPRMIADPDRVDRRRAVPASEPVAPPRSGRHAVAPFPSDFGIATRETETARGSNAVAFSPNRRSAATAWPVIGCRGWGSALRPALRVKLDPGGGREPISRRRTIRRRGLSGLTHAPRAHRHAACRSRPRRGRAGSAASGSRRAGARRACAGAGAQAAGAGPADHGLRRPHRGRRPAHLGLGAQGRRRRGARRGHLGDGRRTRPLRLPAALPPGDLHRRPEEWRGRARGRDRELRAGGPARRQGRPGPQGRARSAGLGRTAGSGWACRSGGRGRSQG